MYKRIVKEMATRELRNFFKTLVEITEIQANRTESSFIDFKANVFYRKGIEKIEGYVSPSANVYVWDEDNGDYVKVN